MRTPAGIVLICLALGQPATAQSPDPLPARVIAWSAFQAERDVLSERAIDTWIRDYRSWQEWADKWLNRPQWAAHPFPYPFWKETPDMFSYVASRRVEPEPPIGLEAACAERAGAAAGRDTLAQACGLLTVWKDDYATQRIRWAMTTSRAQKDDTTRTRFLEHIHFASLWTNVQTGTGDRAYGLAGIHATIDIHGRWQVYALPGIVAVSLPNLQGRRIVTIGYDWGMAVRLFNLRIPYVDLPLKAHLNLVEVWMPEVDQKISMAGLSFTVHKQ